MPVFLFLKTLRVFCAFYLLLVATVDVEHMELNLILVFEKTPMFWLSQKILVAKC